VRIGSLFTGYGGLDLGVMEAIGGELAWVADNNPAASQLLAARFPNAFNIGDVSAYGDCGCGELIPWDHLPPIDVLTAGYPCQPFSTAGLRKGAEDERHLWPYVADAISGLEPRAVILENVVNHLRIGFGQVLDDLAGLGYRTRWGVVRASDAGAPHGRARVFALATHTDYATQFGRVQPRMGPRGDAGRRHADHSPIEWGDFGPAVRRWERITGRPSPVPYGRATHGRPRLEPEWVEWLMGLPRGWVTGPLPDADLFGMGQKLSRHDALVMLGNGVVPQQAALALDVLFQGAANDLRKTLATV